MWFKKKAYIIGYNSNTAVDGTDWRTNGNSNSWSVSQTLPSAADAGKYFYLPALGNYNTGYLIGVGYYGYYWSSSAGPLYFNNAYGLGFNSGSVNVFSTYDRVNGYRVDGFE